MCVWARALSVTAFGWDCGPVGGNDLGKMTDGKKTLQSTMREEKRRGVEIERR